MPADPTRYCGPPGRFCESCAASNGGLAVVVVEALGRPLCLTLCARCAASGLLPSIQLRTAERLVVLHAGHVAEANR